MAHFPLKIVYYHFDQMIYLAIIKRTKKILIVYMPSSLNSIVDKFKFYFKSYIY